MNASTRYAAIPGSDDAAAAEGVSFAFTVGAALSLIAVVGSFFVKNTREAHTETV